MRISLKCKDRKRGQRNYPEKSPIIVTTVPRELQESGEYQAFLVRTKISKEKNEEIPISQEKRRTEKDHW